MTACAAIGPASGRAAAGPAEGTTVQPPAAAEAGDPGEFACPMFDPTDAGKHVRNALEPLMEGDEASARTELRLALCQDPDDAAAKSLLSHLDAAPRSVLGGEFFLYTVRSGDSMPKIAKEFLGDPYKFYLLARYNGMKRPGRLRLGQCVKIPGPRERDGRRRAEQLYGCGLEQLKVGEVKGANEFLREAAEADPSYEEARTRAAELKPAVVEAYRKDAIAALRERNLGQVIWNAQKILETDPHNGRAEDLLRQVEDMRARLVGLLYEEAVAAFERQDWAEAVANCDEVLELDPENEKARALRLRTAGR